MKKLLYFTGTWCQPCRYFGPVIDSIKNEITVEKYDVDERRDLTSKYLIRSIPAIILVDESGNEIKRRTGATSKEEVMKFING